MNKPTSAMSTDEEIVDSIISKKAESDDEEEDVDEDTGVTVKTTIITKDEALMRLEKLQAYFEHCNPLSSSPIVAFEAISRLRGQVTLTARFQPLQIFLVVISSMCFLKTLYYMLYSTN